MRVLAIILATVLLYTSVVHKVRALEYGGWIIVRELVITTPNSTTVPLGEHLYTVSQNRTHLHVNSTNPTYTPCNIAFDPFEDAIVSEMKVVTAHDREIFILGVQNHEIDDGKMNTFYTLLSIDPWTCSYKAVPIRQPDDAEPPKKFLPTLIRYNPTKWGDQGFDVFLPSLKRCRPCRFNIDGTGRSTYFLNFPDDVNANEDPFHLHWMDPDYFYVYNINDGKSVVKFLDDVYLSPKKERYNDYSVDAVAFKKGIFRNVGICSKHRNNRLVDVIRYDEICCERLNSKLQSILTISIPISNKTVSSVALDFDDKGNVYVSFAENNELRVNMYDVIGRLLHSYYLGDVDETFESANSTSQWDTRGFLAGKEYCVVVERTKTDGYEGALHVVKCIRIDSNPLQSRF